MKRWEKIIGALMLLGIIAAYFSGSRDEPEQPLWKIEGEGVHVPESKRMD